MQPRCRAYVRQIGRAEGRSVSACRRDRRLSGLTAALLLLVGCGHSSTGKSAATTPARPSTAGSTGRSSGPPRGPSTSVAAGTVTGSAGGVTATLHAGHPHPKVNRPWPLRFTVTRGATRRGPRLSYEYLFAGQVVAHRSHYTFTGRFRGRLQRGPPRPPATR